MKRRWIVLALFALAVVVILTTDVGAQLVDGAKEFVLRALGKSEAARLATLEPEVQDAVQALREQLAQQGIEVFIGSAGRTPAEQEDILEKGTSSTSHSWHLLGRAVDIYPINPDTGSADLAGKRDDLFRAMHSVAATLGFTGLAYNDDGSRRTLINAQGKPYWDGGHLQFQEGQTFAEAAAQEGFEG